MPPLSSVVTMPPFFLAALTPTPTWAVPPNSSHHLSYESEIVISTAWSLSNVTSLPPIWSSQGLEVLSTKLFPPRLLSFLSFLSSSSRLSPAPPPLEPPLSPMVSASLVSLIPIYSFSSSFFFSSFFFSSSGFTYSPISGSLIMACSPDSLMLLS